MEYKLNVHSWIHILYTIAGNTSDNTWMFHQQKHLLPRIQRNFKLASQPRITMPLSISFAKTNSSFLFVITLPDLKFYWTFWLGRVQLSSLSVHRLSLICTINMCSGKLAQMSSENWRNWYIWEKKIWRKWYPWKTVIGAKGMLPKNHTWIFSNILILLLFS